MGTAVSKRKTLRNEAMSSVAAKVSVAFHSLTSPTAFQYRTREILENRFCCLNLLGFKKLSEMRFATMPRVGGRAQQESLSRRRGSLVTQCWVGCGDKFTSSGQVPCGAEPAPDQPIVFAARALAALKRLGVCVEEQPHPEESPDAARTGLGLEKPQCEALQVLQAKATCELCFLCLPEVKLELCSALRDLQFAPVQTVELPVEPGAGWRAAADLGGSHDTFLQLSQDDVPIRTWFPKENLFSFHTATTTMQANFRKHLRMVGSRRVKAQTFAERRERSFSRSWSDPTPIKADSFHDSRESHDLQDSCGTLEGDFDLNWEAEKELEAMACDGEDFIPPKIMLISSKVPKAEYVPTIIRRDDPSIIPILYDHEHATFDDILEEIEKKLNIYRKGCKIWKMLIFCQGGPGHLYLLKNKVATFAKVEKEEDLILFWKRLSRLMSKVNPEPNIIHIMGCYVLGNPNGEKLFQNLKNLMNPYRVAFESPLELSAQGKQMIETYFDFRLYRLWKTRQHSKLLDYDDIL
ncbi:NMDA receptor synaptonuclear signaling and neuronal migration factor [Pitangus sulphuratus]|nr:NMDA receptor synaptonuclear signaling and neuronal migration factor [Pitangus sulphuratus]